MYDSNVKSEALLLRTTMGYSLNQIRDRLKVSKATLSQWLRNIPASTTPEGIRLAQSEAKLSKKEQELENARQFISGMIQDLEDFNRTYSNYQHLLPTKSITTSEKGNIAEAVVRARLAMMCLPVYTPLGDGEKYDLLVETSSGLKKVQVKWASPQKLGRPTANITCSDSRQGQRPYRMEELDFLIVYDMEVDCCYIWKYDEISHLKKSVTTTPEACESWQKLT